MMQHEQHLVALWETAAVVYFVDGNLHDDILRHSKLSQVYAILPACKFNWTDDDCLDDHVYRQLIKTKSGHTMKHDMIINLLTVKTFQMLEELAVHITLPLLSAHCTKDIQ